MRLTKQQVQDFTHEDEGFEDGGFKIVERDNWESHGKYEYSTVILEREGKFYSLDISRTGSPYSDYTYSYEWVGDKGEEIKEVEKVEVVTYDWKEKKNG